MTAEAWHERLRSAAFDTSSLLPAPSALAQSVPAPIERFGIGGVGGPGTAGTLASARLSVAAAPRVSFDIDLALISNSSDRARAAAGAQLSNGSAV